MLGTAHSHVLHRHVDAHLPVIVAGEGVYLFDRDGRRYLDASGGPAVSCLGHSHPDVIRALTDQLGRVSFAYSGFFTHDALEALADRLIASAPAAADRQLDRVFFTCGGSEAVEAALKLARQYFVETGQPQRRQFIARRQSYHGNTLGALAAGGHVARRAPYLPLLMPASHIAPCYAYRGRGPDETEEAYGRRVADELEQAILAAEPDSVAAFLAEPVVGAALGAVPAVSGYFRRIREICDRYGVLLILDEIMCGMGRTGTLFAYEQEGIVPDMAVIGKGLGGGYQPIAALLASDRIIEGLAAGSGAFMHGHTYAGHTLGCVAALAVQQVIERDRLLDRVQQLGAGLRARLDDRFGNHPHVGDIRGRGLFLGLELVADRAAKRPFDPAAGIAARLRDRALALGLVCYPSAGTADGHAGDHVILAPPYIAEDAHLDAMVELLGHAVDETTRSGHRRSI